MGFPGEDDVDWGDSPLDDEAPLPINPHSESHANNQATQEDCYPSPKRNEDHHRTSSQSDANPQDPSISSKPCRHERLTLPFGEPSPGPRVEPTKEDYTKFVLDQASQKIYESMFLRSFVNRALHTNQIGEILPDNDVGARIKRYLTEVSSNVDQIVAKIICNTHSRAINALAHDDVESALFWDCKMFDESIFNDITPESFNSPVDRLQECWHSACNPLPMIHSSKKYCPVGGHCPASDEGDRVSGILPEKNRAQSRPLRRNSLALCTWRTKLIRDHKRRLATRRHTARESVSIIDFSISAIVSDAIFRGIIKPKAGLPREELDTPDKTRLAQTARCSGRTSDPSPSNHFKRKRKQPPTPSLDRRQGHRRPKKKRKLDLEQAKSVAKVNTPVSASHPSGSKTLEHHQVLPPNASFEPTHDGDMPAWRCGIKHVMGYYYNAGDRRNCIGCFTSITHNPRLKRMDFYLPSRSYCYQPAPGVVWTPSKPSKEPRRSKNMSHNSIAKVAFWDSISTGSSADDARRVAIAAVETHLRPKTQPPREPSAEPIPTPVSVPLGPHPSGSAKMEHGQNIPECFYWEDKLKGEELAWRCDVNHALGRYYLAGNKHSCPGCGSSKNGQGKRVEMDFYLPDGVVVRQEAPDLINWQPRRPYKIKDRKPDSKRQLTHNQICSGKYWELIKAGLEHKQALAVAIAQTDADIDAKNEEVRFKEGTQKTDPEPHRKAKSIIQSPQSSESGIEDEKSSVPDYRIRSLVPRRSMSQAISEHASDRSVSDTSSDDNTSSSDDE